MNFSDQEHFIKKQLRITRVYQNMSVRPFPVQLKRCDSQVMICFFIVTHLFVAYHGKRSSSELNLIE